MREAVEKVQASKTAGAENLHGEAQPASIRKPAAAHLMPDVGSMMRNEHGGYGGYDGSMDYVKRPSQGSSTDSGHSKAKSLSIRAKDGLAGILKGLTGDEEDNGGS